MEAQILQRTFAFIQPSHHDFACTFYKILFTKYPEVQPLFADVNMEQQEKKLIYSLSLIVESMGRLDSLKCILKNLGRRHLRYKVVADYYPLVGEVLFETLEIYLGSEWTPEVATNWKKAYQTIADFMLEGSKDEYEFSSSPSLSSSSSDSNSQKRGIQTQIKQLRLKAISQRALNHYHSSEVATKMIMKDNYVKDVEKKVGKDKTAQMVSALLKEVKEREEIKS